MRLVTRGNFDGLTCAVLITEVESIDSIELIHPQDITDSRFKPREGDIVVNLPYKEGCSKWFDHHPSTRNYNEPPTDFEGSHDLAPSSGRVVYDYYLAEHPEIVKFEELVREDDRFDEANLGLEDVNSPQGWILLAFTIDPRSGLGRFREYFLDLMDRIKTMPLDKLLETAEVRERVERFHKEKGSFLLTMSKHSRVDGNVIVSDLREVENVPAGNRFLIYTLYPEANVSVRIAWGPMRAFAVITVGTFYLQTDLPGARRRVDEALRRWRSSGGRGDAGRPRIRRPSPRGSHPGAQRLSRDQILMPAATRFIDVEAVLRFPKKSIEIPSEWVDGPV